MGEIGFSRDLLQRFSSTNQILEMSNLEEDDDVELSLGLSLNGQFGSDPERGKKKIFRASSISNFTMMSSSDAGTYVPIGRTCSLVETEEWRKRKELQSMRRMEAKRKRLEKLKNVRNVREKVCLEEDNNNNASTNWGEENGNLGGKKVCLEEGMQLQPPLQPLSQGSIGSQGSGSSGISDFYGQPIRGMSKFSEARSPVSVQSPPQQVEQSPAATPALTANRASKPVGGLMGMQVTTVAEKDTIESAKNMMFDMPCVSTTGGTPNGKRIEGFLYRYRKGEEVRIVCVCHGSFLTPAEFIKHAGGGDVTHPLRHIVVNHSTF